MVRVIFRFQCLVLLSALALSFAQPAVRPVAAQTRAAPPASALIDLNSASRDALMELDGIGEVRADAIIRARPFKAKAELVERWIVPEQLYEKIADKVTVRPVAAPPPAPRPAAPTKR
ncbi:MAG: helix-hairpin-helix domain-containing protein [Alphaproteobacteria bacterium]|nr:helix-hairpin-helix domain-containing protein [Alphaproteobacteria bacterium]